MKALPFLIATAITTTLIIATLIVRAARQA